MNNIKKILFLLCLLWICRGNVHAIDFWQYPEMADKNALFVGIFPVQFTFTDYFTVRQPEFYVDYLLPVGVPVSLGASINPIDPDVYSFGGRLGYHINFNDEKFDVYVLYQVEILYLIDVLTHDKYVVVEFGGRFGIRRRFGEFLCFTFESGFKFRYFNIGIAIKCN